MRLLILVTLALASTLSAQTGAGGGSSAPLPGPKTKWYAGAGNPSGGIVSPGAVRHTALQLTVERYPSATSATNLARFGANPKGTLSPGYILQFELWEDVNADGTADAGDVQIGQSYDGNFPYPTLAPIQPGQTVHILLTVDIDQAAPLGSTMKIISPRQSLVAYPFNFQFSPSETEFGALITVGAVSFGGVLGGPQTVDLPSAPQLEVSDSMGPFASGTSAAGDRDFGAVDVGNMPSVWNSITVANTGTADLQLGTPTLSGLDAASFVLDVSGFSTLVTPGTATTFNIAFDAMTIGAKVATVEFTNNAGANFTFEVAGNATSSSFPVITPASLPPATTNSAYGPVQLAVSGGVPAYAFSVAGGALPTGMQLSLTGEISGTPTAAGGYQFTALVTDSVGASNSQVFSLDVIDGPGPGAGSGTGAGCAVGGASLLPMLLPLLLPFRRKRRGS
jgi:hypothetical protein